MSASNKERKVPVLVDKPMDFCPGCGHGIISRLIMECLDELEQSDNIIFPIGVGCSSNLGAGLECDRLHCSHGRAGAVATGMKRVNPDVLIVSYQGDGDAYNIGIAETFNAAYRNENITVIVVNNTNFGMTGGQMCPATTLVGDKTVSSKKGRDDKVAGEPFDMLNILQNYKIAYAARGSLCDPKHIDQTKKMLKKGFENQRDKKGFSIIEILSPCPTNWKLSPADAMKKMKEENEKVFPVKVYVDNGGDE